MQQSSRPENQFGNRLVGIAQNSNTMRLSFPICALTGKSSLARFSPLFRNQSRVTRRIPRSARALLGALLWLGWAIGGSPAAFGQPVAVARPQGNVVIVKAVVSPVEFSRAGSTGWDPSYAGQELKPGDQLRTGERGSATVQLTDLTLLRLGETSRMQIPEGKQRSAFRFLKGVLYFFHRDRPGDFELETPTVSAVVRGTEFNLRVAENGATTLDLIDGEVDMGNEFGRITLKSGQGAIAEPGQKPVGTAVIDAVNVIQWCLYYPGVLDLSELSFSAEDHRVLNGSFTAYRSGDLPAALAQYPAGRQPVADEDKIYLAALLLAVGQVDRAGDLIASLAPEAQGSSRGGKPSLPALGLALRKVVAAVKFQAFDSAAPPGSATEWLAESYYQQSQSKLDQALSAAWRALDKSPQFAFAWERVAELEFSSGHTEDAVTAMEMSLHLAPRNAQALALKGFLLSAQNKIAEALTYFEQAIQADGALSNGWLGRGLCRIRQGKVEEGRMDLQMAATLEPQRAVLRSYLGKAFSQTGDLGRAQKELALARKLDPNDPTSWLYSALLNQQQNRVNDAVRDLERSQELNPNRRVYRSQLLLDQDRAVRGANLAAVYEDAGMTEVSAREASRAVGADYGNYSAHLFLANSFSSLRDPRGINLRYETPTVSEYLVANLLAPVGGGALSPTVTQQEYSRLFERDHLGVASSTEYSSRGDWLQSGAQYGRLGNMSYALDAFYRSENGQRPNNDLESTELSLKVQQQITPKDSAYFQAIYANAKSGDLGQYYDPTRPVTQGGPNPGLRTKESQEPILLGGYHHEWSPGVHTLFLAGRLQDTFEYTDPFNSALLLDKRSGNVTAVNSSFRVPLDYRSDLEIYTAEVQQIWKRGNQHLIAGARYQFGDFDTHNQLPPFRIAGGAITVPGVSSSVVSDFERFSIYAYHHWQVAEPLLLIAGVTYDQLTYPQNFRSAPISSGEETQGQVSPKVGLIWTPAQDTTVRAAYTRSLSGVSFDQSFQLEPSQVAGFTQTYRSLIPESVAGASSGAMLESWGLALDQKFPSRTYFGLTAELLKSEVDRQRGTYDFVTVPAMPLPVVTFVPGMTRETLDYEERTFTATVNQLVGREWSLGGRYRLSQADLEVRYPGIPANLSPASDPNTTAVLNQVTLFAIYNHPTGFFAQVESLWTAQSNQGYHPDIPGDAFWQFNAFAGYRFPRRRAELRVGLLNISDQDYRVNPLNLTTELPRQRTFVMNFKFSF